MKVDVYPMTIAPFCWFSFFSGPCSPYERKNTKMQIFGKKLHLWEKIMLLLGHGRNLSFAHIFSYITKNYYKQKSYGIVTIVKYFSLILSYSAIMLYLLHLSPATSIWAHFHRALKPYFPKLSDPWLRFHKLPWIPFFLAESRYLWTTKIKCMKIRYK